MKKYKLVYEIHVEADSRLEAALQVEGYLNDTYYRPCFEITDEAGKVETLDLEDFGPNPYE